MLILPCFQFWVTHWSCWPLQITFQEPEGSMEEACCLEDKGNNAYRGHSGREKGTEKQNFIIIKNGVVWLCCVQHIMLQRQNGSLKLGSVFPPHNNGILKIIFLRVPSPSMLTLTLRSSCYNCTHFKDKKLRLGEVICSWPPAESGYKLKWANSSTS